MQLNNMEHDKVKITQKVIIKYIQINLLNADQKISRVDIRMKCRQLLKA